jgi:DNA-binding MarR family transcriptional regulator
LLSLAKYMEIAEPTTPVIASDLRLVVGRLARKVRLADTSGLTPSQLSALVSIDQIGSARLCDVAAAEGVSAPTATRIVGALEKAGLVARADDSEDRRATRLVLTASGRAALRRIRSSRTAFLQQRLERLGEDDLATLRAALPVLAALAGDEL